MTDRFPWYKPKEGEVRLSDEELEDIERMAEPNDTCGCCGGPALQQYGLGAGGIGTYTVCLSESCDKITKWRPDHDNIDIGAKPC